MPNSLLSLSPISTLSTGTKGGSRGRRGQSFEFDSLSECQTCIETGQRLSTSLHLSHRAFPRPLSFLARDRVSFPHKCGQLMVSKKCCHITFLAPIPLHCQRRPSPSSLAGDSAYVRVLLSPCSSTNLTPVQLFQRRREYLRQPSRHPQHQDHSSWRQEPERLRFQERHQTLRSSRRCR